MGGKFWIAVSFEIWPRRVCELTSLASLSFPFASTSNEPVADALMCLCAVHAFLTIHQLDCCQVSSMFDVLFTSTGFVSSDLFLSDNSEFFLQICSFRLDSSGPSGSVVVFFSCARESSARLCLSAASETLLR